MPTLTQGIKYQSQQYSVLLTFPEQTLVKVDIWDVA